MKKYSNAARAARRELLAATMLATLAMSPVSLALAQTADPPPAEGSGAIALPTVEVTATEEGGKGEGGEGRNAPKEGYSAPPVLQSTTKIDVPIFDLPIALQTVPEQVIVDQNALRIEDALANVSGVRWTSTTNQDHVFTIRGFETDSVFRDGQLKEAAISESYDTANLQSIEVLNGPASFLFGRAGPGGVINLVTKKPLDVPYYSLTQEFGSFNLYRTVFDLTGPVEVPVVADGSVSYQFSGSYTNGGQFIDFVKDRNVFLAPAVTWKIGPSTTLTVEAEYRHEDAVPEIGIPAIGMYPASLPRYRSFLEPNEPVDTICGALISEEFNHHIDNNWAITSRFLAERATIESSDIVPSALDLNTATVDRNILYQKLTDTNYSTNLDLTGKFNVIGARNDILIGADYFYRFFNYIISADGSFPINLYNPIYGTVPTSAFTSAAFKAWSGTADQFTSFSSRAAKDLGVYAQDSITLFDNLHVLLGGRYDLADLRNGSGRTFAIASKRFGTSPNRHDQAFSPRVGLVYQPVLWLGFYGSY